MHQLSLQRARCADIGDLIWRCEGEGWQRENNEVRLPNECVQLVHDFFLHIQLTLHIGLTYRQPQHPHDADPIPAPLDPNVDAMKTRLANDTGNTVSPR